MMANWWTAVSHAARTERDDLLVQPVDPGLALGDQAGLEAALPVARSLDLERAVLALHGLAAHAVAPVRLHERRLLPVLVAQVLGQLGAQHPLHQRLPEILHQPAVAQLVLRPLAALQQLIQHALLSSQHGPAPPYTKDRTLSNTSYPSNIRYRTVWYLIVLIGTIPYLLDRTNLFAPPVRAVAQCSWSSGSTTASVRPAMRALRPTFERWIST